MCFKRDISCFTKLVIHWLRETPVQCIPVKIIRWLLNRAMIMQIVCKAVIEVMWLLLKHQNKTFFVIYFLHAISFFSVQVCSTIQKVVRNMDWFWSIFRIDGFSPVIFVLIDSPYFLWRFLSLFSFLLVIELSCWKLLTLTWLALQVIDHLTIWGIWQLNTPGFQLYSTEERHHGKSRKRQRENEEL